MLEAEAVQKYVNLQLILILKISSGACERVVTCKNRRNLVPREYLVFLFCQKRTERSCLLACLRRCSRQRVSESLEVIQSISPFAALAALGRLSGPPQLEPGGRKGKTILKRGCENR